MRESVFLQFSQKCVYQADGMLCSLNLKDRIVHHIGLVRFIGDRPNDDEGNSVEVCGLRDSCAFHLCTESMVGIDQALFHFRLVDELVAGDDAAFDDCVT